MKTLLQTMTARLGGRRLRSFDEAQGGAVILLVLAGFLILILTSMLMYDAGTAAQDKVGLQTAADSAAYSQSVIKARSMNTISYANTAKRVFYSYNFIYWSALFAYIESLADYIESCSIPFGIYHCIRAIIGGIQGIGEVINFATNVMPMINRSRAELSTLDHYQAYMKLITPWWSYAENLLRGVYNGATVTATWPPPATSLDGSIEEIIGVGEEVEDALGTDYIPSGTGFVDQLPVRKAEGTASHFQYCLEYLASPEHLLVAWEHSDNSDGGATGISGDNQTQDYFDTWMWSPTSCIIASVFLGGDLLDYRVDGGGAFPSEMDHNEWMQKTATLTLAYQARDHSGVRRGKFDFMAGDHTENPKIATDGNWSMARSEIFFGQSAIQSTLTDLPIGGGMMDGLSSIGSNILAGPLVAAQGDPHMWSPRWTARLRPVKLPGESLGDMDAGLDNMMRDMVPQLVTIGTAAGFVDDHMTLASALQDLVFLYHSSSALDGDSMEGLTQ